jgi:hypothetical protein
MLQDNPFRKIVEAAGAEFVAETPTLVFFRASGDGRVMSLYRVACTGENVRLAIKSAHERVQIELQREVAV